MATAISLAENGSGDPTLASPPNKDGSIGLGFSDWQPRPPRRARLTTMKPNRVPRHLPRTHSEFKSLCRARHHRGMKLALRWRRDVPGTEVARCLVR